MTVICNPKMTPDNQLKTTVRSQKRKRRIMDSDLAAKCKVVLDKLLKHDHAYMFFDRVVAGFRDAGYFSVIKHPMDLGTVQKKLDNDIYVDVEEFESDVKLTFDNAMIYTPRHCVVHQNAKELNLIFEDLWKSIMAEDMTMTASDIKSKKKVYCVYEKPSAINLNRIRLKAPQILLVLQSRPGSGIATGRVIKIKQKKSSKVAEAEHAVKVVRQKTREAARMTLHKMDRSVHTKMEAPVGNPMDFAPVWPSVDNQGRISPNQVSVQEQKKVYESQPNTSEVGSQQETKVEVSTSQALRVARLKKRFAWIIVKARQALMELSKPSNNVTDQDRLIKLEKEKDKMVAEAEHEIRRLIQKERHAARMALEKLEQSVDVEDNFSVMREMEALVGHPVAFMPLWCS